MPRLNANPQAEANVAFDLVKPGQYRMRMESGTTDNTSIAEFQSKSGNKCLRIRAAFVDIGALTKEDGTDAKNPGTLLDSGLVLEPKEKQGKLRSMMEACGLPWSSIDDDRTWAELLNGKEFDATVGVEEYEGTQKNVIKRYLPIKV
jgi:hypothetical protein